MFVFQLLKNSLWISKTKNIEAILLIFQSLCLHKIFLAPICLCHLAPWILSGDILCWLWRFNLLSTRLVYPDKEGCSIHVTLEQRWRWERIHWSRLPLSSQVQDMLLSKHAQTEQCCTFKSRWRDKRENNTVTVTFLLTISSYPQNPSWVPLNETGNHTVIRCVLICACVFVGGAQPPGAGQVWLAMVPRHT